MFNINGYSPLEEIETGPHTRICRFLRLEDNKKVILKMPRSEHPTNREIANLEHEFILLKQLHSPGIIQVYDLISPQITPILVLEDSNGQSLSSFLKGRPISLKQFFAIALQLTTILDELYQHHIIHKDIKPANIIIEPITLAIKLADFSISSQLNEETQEQTLPELLEGTLAYMSPEQTGRMNRPIDYRTDFYSLGVTFFEMLTGAVPFQTTDPLELAYAHIAKIPPLVSNLNSSIPHMVSVIVAKLLSKAPEDRYAHILRLKKDLEKCAEQWLTKQQIDIFELGQHDIQDKLQLSHKLYGRAVQVNSLLTIFEKINQGSSQLMLISGYPGIGKTSLVNEIHKPITQQRGFFISGKFDQLKRSPYSAVVEAFRSIIKQLLAEPELKLNQYKQHLLKRLSNNGQIIIDVLPEVALIIGPQPTVPELNPQEAQNRFNLTFLNFVQVFAQADHPLVLFLDDLQWADSASLKFIENLLSDPTMRYLLIIGAYRDNETDANHPLRITLQRLIEAGVLYQSITLQPLQLADIEQLLADVFVRSINSVTPLAKLLLEKTQGNPFFINEFLKTLYHEKLIYFFPAESKWVWDITQIAQQNITDNVVDLLVTKIQRLSDTSQQTLKSAACIGHNFDLQTLAIILEQSFEHIALQLSEAQRTNLIIPLGDTYKTTALLQGRFELPTMLIEEKLTYRFAHDRIQQAAYSLIPIETRQHTHLKIGKMLLKEHPLEEYDERLFDLLDHYNQGLSLISDATEKIQLAQYNLWAGKKAMASAAYQSASSYFGAGITLVDDATWDNHYELIFYLYQEQIQCFYQLGLFEQADSYFDLMTQHTRSNLEKANSALIKMRAYGTMGDHAKGVAVGVEALQLLGFHIATNVSQLKVLSEIALIHCHIGLRKVANLDKDLIRTTDPKIIVTIKLLSNLLVPSYLINPKLYAYIICKIVNMSLTLGYTEETSTAYFGYAILLIGALNKIPLAADFVTLAKKLEKNAYSAEIATKNNFLYAFFIKHWYEHATDHLSYLQERFEKALELGNIEYATYSQTFMFTLYHTSKPLPELTQNFNDGMLFLKRVKNDSWYRHGLLQLWSMQVLQGQTVPTEDFEALWDKVKSDSTALQAGSYGDYSEFLYMLGDFSAALIYAQQFFKLKDNIICYIGYAFGYLFYGLSLAKCLPTSSNKVKKAYWKQLLIVQQQLKYWARHCPSNYQFMYAVISAEVARLSNQPLKAASLYNEAIIAAQSNGYISYVAVINECAASFYIESKNLICAEAYIRRAHYAYQRWGASYKCQLLAKQYPEWIKTISTNNTIDNTTSTMTSGTFSSHEFDFMTILKASQTIASEMQLHKLLQKLLQIAFENAGAQKGALLFEQQNQLIVVAEGNNEQSVQVNLQGIPLEMHKSLPKSVLAYVQRTHENLLLNNENEMSQFQQDPYIQSNNPKSLLCIPILQHGRALAYLYLENQLTSNAFTAERLKVLLLLGGQTAISLENAKLYSATSRFVPYEFLHQINRQNLVQVQLGDQIQREMTVLFCDIRNFTTLSEKLTPAEIFTFINLFLGHMEPVIKKHQGFVDKYIGDAIMALFEQPNQAVKAGLEILKQLEEFNKESNHPPIKIGVGINTGELMLGIIGDQNRIEGSVLGDAVNIASRLETLTKQYSADLLISDATKVQLQKDAFNLYVVGDITVKGKTKPVTVWGVLENDPDAEN